MTVGELIRELADCDPQLEVRIEVANFGCSKARSVYTQNKYAVINDYPGTIAEEVSNG